MKNTFMYIAIKSKKIKSILAVCVTHYYFKKPKKSRQDALEITISRAHKDPGVIADAQRGLEFEPIEIECEWIWRRRDGALVDVLAFLCPQKLLLERNAHAPTNESTSACHKNCARTVRRFRAIT